MEGSIRLVPDTQSVGPVWAEFRGERIYFPDMLTARETLDKFAAFGIHRAVVELADGTAQVRYLWSAIAQAKFARLGHGAAARIVRFAAGREGLQNDRKGGYICEHRY